jgi:hypothetical protein
MRTGPRSHSLVSDLPLHRGATDGQEPASWPLSLAGRQLGFRLVAVSAALVAIWVISIAAASIYLSGLHEPIQFQPLKSPLVRSNTSQIRLPVATQPPHTANPKLLSRHPSVEAICSKRGNLGPCSVVIQDPPGSDWLKDRWQAASDMGGTAIPGHHWIVLDFHRSIRVAKVVIDWESAYANEYKLEFAQNITEEINYNKCDWGTLFDNRVAPEHNR